jgi:hypothetical protein
MKAEEPMFSKVSGAAGKASHETGLIPARIPLRGDAARPLFWENPGQEVRSMPPEKRTPAGDIKDLPPRDRTPFDTSLGEAYHKRGKGLKTIPA